MKIITITTTIIIIELKKNNPKHICIVNVEVKENNVYHYVKLIIMEHN